MSPKSQDQDVGSPVEVSVKSTLRPSIAKVKLALAENDKTSSSINVEVRSAVVELSGFVASYGERDTAVEMVSDMEGVEDVINSIDITPQ